MDPQLRPPREPLDRAAARIDGGGDQIGRRRRESDPIGPRRRGGAAQRPAGQQAGRGAGRAAPLLAAALLASACLNPLFGEARTSDVTRHEFTLAHGFLHVEVSIPHDPPGRKPAVIGALGLDAQLLALGIAVVRFDTDWSVLRPLADAQAPSGDAATPDGGDAPEPNRVGSWMLAAPRPGIVGQSYFGVIATTARSVPRVFDTVASLPGIDPQRIAIAGSSTHGFVALEALRAEPRLAAAVVRVACGDYHRFLRSSSLALNDDPRWLPGGELVLDDDYERALREQEPVHDADAYPPRPLLLLNGANDPAIPRACAEHTAAALKHAYHAAGFPERFRFRLYPDAGHDLGPDAEAQVLAWWKQWLLNRPVDAS